MDSKKSISFSGIPANTYVNLQIYAVVTSAATPGCDVQDILVGTYKVTIDKPVNSANSVVNTARNEYNIWTRSYLGKTVDTKQTKINQYFQKAAGRDWVIGESWCAGFVSYCLLTNGYGNYLPAPTAEWGKGRLNCQDMVKHFSKVTGTYVSNYTTNRAAVLNNVKPGDVVFFMGKPLIPNEAYHVGIVISVDKSARKICYIDGNAGANSDILCRDFDLDYTPYTGTDYYYIVGFGLLHK